MVSASRFAGSPHSSLDAGSSSRSAVQSAAGAADSAREPVLSFSDGSGGTGGAGIEHSGKEPSRSLNEGSEDGPSSGYNDADPFDLPLSYGERLVLDTYLRGRSRPYDRDRQEFLAQPRKRGEDASRSQSLTASTTASQGRSLDRASVADMIDRLTQPKVLAARARNAGECIVSQHREEVRKKREEVNLAEVTQRLSQPRRPPPASPSPGEREVVLSSARIAGRSIDRQRLAQLSRATRRGGSCAAWGVQPHEPSTARAHAYSLASTTPRQSADNSHFIRSGTVSTPRQSAESSHQIRSARVPGADDVAGYGSRAPRGSETFDPDCGNGGTGDSGFDAMPGSSLPSSRPGTGWGGGTGGVGGSAVPTLPLATGQPVPIGDSSGGETRNGSHTQRSQTWRSGVDRRPV